ncbi:MAG: TIGR04282 family arsenosugar biosynthesis glycosyltransferase [Candidatus Eremiobacteraeota bacterium]|nr:TIGR04282 family arsenosugar biosynthesis glycosyltransferase [Candidatus Eremiobacteraeota bacterium]
MARLAFGVIMKAPKDGYVKTRLVPPLTSAQATDLHRCFVQDTCANLLEVATEVPIAAFSVYTPVGAENAVRELVPPEFELLLQRGETFGERLFYAAEDLLELGYDGAFLMDSDSPTIPTETLIDAARALSVSGDRATIGPCEDGGYFLLGLKSPHRRLFEDIAWSTSSVASQTCARAGELGLPMTQLEPWYDVDDAASLHALREEFANSCGARRQGYEAKYTRRYIEDLFRPNRVPAGAKA